MVVVVVEVVVVVVVVLVVLLYYHHGLSASAAPHSPNYQGIRRGGLGNFKTPISNQLRLLSFAAGAMIAQFLAEEPI